MSKNRTVDARVNLPIDRVAAIAATRQFLIETSDKMTRVEDAEWNQQDNGVVEAKATLVKAGGGPAMRMPMQALVYPLFDEELTFRQSSQLPGGMGTVVAEFVAVPSTDDPQATTITMTLTVDIAVKMFAKKLEKPLLAGAESTLQGMVDRFYQVDKELSESE